MIRRSIHGLGAVSLLLLLAGGVVAGSTLTLEVDLEGMEPHLGQRLEARLVEVASGMETARRVISAIASGAFNLDFGGVEEGASYVLDFYADLNGNGAYDAPPLDHAWRLEVPAFEESMSLSFVHNTSFTDIAWPDEEGSSDAAVDGMIGADEYTHFFRDAETGMDVYWMNDETTLTMGLVSPGTGWVSAGFDPVNVMEGANFILAAMVDGVLVIEDHFGTGRFRHTIDASQDILEAAGTEAGGMTTVEFAIPLDSGDAFDTQLLPGGSHVLLLAYHASADGMSVRHTRRSTGQITLD